jgi:pimeloyl-ACP methyl ester carboxylesterase
MKRLVLLTAILATYHARASAQAPAPPIVRFIAVDRDVKLQVVDWGGSGRPVVLLAGLGVTARDLDGFAHALTSTYHVVGLTRRGFAPSSMPAAFERSLRARQKLLPPLDSSASRTTAQPVDTGFDLGQAILEGHQRYTRIDAPVLAIFALPHRMPARVATDPRQLAQWRTWEAEGAAQADAFERTVVGARVVRLPDAEHFVYRSNAADVLREIRAFVATLPP